jgi:hypothetical protein
MRSAHTSTVHTMYINAAKICYKLSVVDCAAVLLCNAMHCECKRDGNYRDRVAIVVQRGGD